MSYLISLLIPLLSVCVVLIPIFLFLRKVHFLDVKYTAVGFAFSSYLAMLLILVGVPTLPYIPYIGFYPNINLIPFADMVDDLRSTVLNVCLFIPLGLLLPIISKRHIAWKTVILFAFGFSLLIELMQIFVSRATDINDLITNTLGAVIGFAFSKAFLKKYFGFLPEGNLSFLCGVTAVSVFFIIPYIEMAFYRYLVFYT